MNNLEKYLEDTDLFLYQKILSLINKEWDNMEPSRLSDLMDKMGELHHNLDQVVIKRNRVNLFKEKVKSKFEFDRVKLIEHKNFESMSLSKILHGIMEQRNKYRF